MTEVSVMHPAGSIFESKFRSHGIKFTYVDEFILRDTTIDRAVQVREAGTIAPGSRVDRYLQQMKAGAKFPPIVIRASDYALLDGNTRVAAATQLGLVTFPAYLVETTTARQARKLAGALNQNGAADLHEAEVRKVAIDAKNDGESDAWIAREFGVDYAKVRRWMAENDGQQHADRCGVTDEFDSLTQNQKVAVSTVKRDEPFRSLVQAVAGHKPPAKELRDLIKAVEAAPTDTAAVESVQEAAAAWPERDPDDSGRREGKPSPALQAKSALGRLLNKPAEEWVDLAHRDDLLPKWQELRDLAESVIRAYRVDA